MDTGSILAALSEENLKFAVGITTSSDDRTALLFRLGALGRNAQAGSTRRHRRAVKFRHGGKYQRGKIPVAHADCL